MGSVIYAGSFEEIYTYIEPYRELCIVVDSNCSTRCTCVSEMVTHLDAEGRLKCLYEFEASEANKTLSSVEDLIREMVLAELGRSVLVLAVGGGITTDLAGFAASVYKRGVRFAFIPTTLLAQSDAAIGGKTGVNFDGYKNMVGVFRQPEFTFICPAVLKTLPSRQILAGAAEILKTFIIADSESYCRAVRLLSSWKEKVQVSGSAQDNDEDFWNSIASLSARAASIKSGIVGKDPYENGLRRVLNLGHTFGHAIEALSAERHYDIIHGEAVAMGIVLAARLADGLGCGLPAENENAETESGEYPDASCEEYSVTADGEYPGGEPIAERIERDFIAVGLPVQSPFTLSELAPFMCKDKKAEGGSVHFVVPESIGHCVVREMSVQEAVAAVQEYDGGESGMIKFIDI